MTPRWLATTGSCLAMLLAFPLSAKDPTFPSAWRSADLVIDGDAGDWAGHLVPLPGVPASVGVQNDGSFLYICFRTNDEGTRTKVRELGLSVWLDASGKSDRKFGIRYPAGPRGSAGADLPDSGDVAFQRSLENAVAGGELRILGKQEVDAARMKVGEARPIEAALGEHEGALVLELKVPLAFGVESPHAIETTPGSTIALGLETTEPKLAKRGGERSGARLGGRGGGGRGGFGGGRGGGRGGRDDEAGTSRSREKAYGKPLKVWFTVPLAIAAPDAQVRGLLQLTD